MYGGSDLLYDRRSKGPFGAPGCLSQSRSPSGIRRVLTHEFSDMEMTRGAYGEGGILGMPDSLEPGIGVG